MVGTPEDVREPDEIQLRIESVSKRFGGVQAVAGVSLEVRRGEMLSVIGPNGAGKSTFFNLITGAFRPDSGRILLDDVDMVGRSPPDIVRHGIGRAFQVASIFSSLTVEETMLAAVCADQRRAEVLHRRFPLGETRERADYTMEMLGLADKLAASPFRRDAYLPALSAASQAFQAQSFISSGSSRAPSGTVQ